MPKKISKILAQAAVILFFTAPFPLFLLAWQDCPFGRVNDPAPGRCNKFVDSDNSGFCDHSEVAAATIRTAGDGSEDAAPAASADGSDDNKDSINVATGTGDKPSAPAENASAAGLANPYLWIFTGFVLAYFASIVSVRLKLANIAGQRKFWNVILLLLFVPTAATSVILVLAPELSGLGPSFLRAVSNCHGKSGFAFVIVAMFHCLWHGAYYAGIFSVKKIATAPKNAQEAPAPPR